MQSVVDLARLDLNDVDKIRNLDVDMLGYANDGISRAFAIRPDLKWGSFGTAYADLALTDAFPLAIEYRSAIADYVVASCEDHDDQFSLEARRVQAMKAFMNDMGFPS